MRLSKFNDFPIVPYGQGIKLISHKICESIFQELPRLVDLLNVNCCSYATDLTHRNLVMNEQALNFCGYNSLTQALKCSMADIAEKYTADKVFSYQKYTMQHQIMNIIEDDVILKNGDIFQSLNFIKPLYDDLDALVGIYGFSIIPDIHSIDNVLAALADLCMFSSSLFYDYKYRYLMRVIKKNIYLSKREWQCILGICKGYTNKTIARILNLSPKTINSYIDNICKKLNLNNKQDIIHFFHQIEI